MFYVCCAIGQADFMPDEQIYICADTPQMLEWEVGGVALRFDTEEAENGTEKLYRYALRTPREGETNWSQRIRIAGDRVLDVIGMSEAEWMEEAQ